MVVLSSSSQIPRVYSAGSSRAARGLRRGSLSYRRPRIPSPHDLSKLPRRVPAWFHAVLRLWRGTCGIPARGGGAQPVLGPNAHVDWARTRRGLSSVGRPAGGAGQIPFRSEPDPAGGVRGGRET